MTRRLWIPLLLLFTASAFAQRRTVTRVEVRAHPRSFSGRCPATIVFSGTIFVSRPSRVTYVWERSDGAHGPRRTVDIRSDRRTVTDRWTLGSRHERAGVWEQLRVLAPTGISSDPARVELYCR